MQKNGYVLVAAALAGAMIALAIGHAMTLHSAGQRLAGYQRQLLSHALDVASAGLGAIAAARHVPHAACSDEDLRELRYQVLQTDLLADIGRLQAGRLVCTALWGRIPAPQRLPPSQAQRASDDSEFWRAARSVTDERLTMDMFRQGNLLVMTAPTAFRHFARPEPRQSAVVMRSNRQHVFQSFGDAQDLLRPQDLPGNRFWTQQLHATGCSQRPDICVAARLTNIGMLHQPAWLLALVAGTGAITGASLAMAALLLRRSQLSMLQQLRRAVLQGRLYVVYQPLVRLRDQRLIGVEVLARLRDDQGVAIPPDMFIGLAERHGLIGTITRQVIDKALTQMSERLRSEPGFHLSINLSATDITDADLPSYLHQQVTRLAIDPAQVVLEITERSTTDTQRMMQGMQTLRQLGYRFHVDDFGTGYSNLAYLSHLPVDGIKLDRMFTQAAGQQAVTSAIIEKVCQITRELGLQLVVEGIETEQQAAHVLELNPDVVGQGWWLGRPAACEDIAPTPDWRPAGQRTADDALPQPMSLPPQSRGDGSPLPPAGAMRS